MGKLHFYTLNDAGRKRLENLSSRSSSLDKYQEAELDCLREVGDVGFSLERWISTPEGTVFETLPSSVLRKIPTWTSKYMIEDSRTSEEVLTGIGTQNPKLAEILRVYKDIAEEKPVSEGVLDRTIKDLERAYGGKETRKLSLDRMDRSEKVIYLDDLISDAHAGALTGAYGVEGRDEDVIRLLDELFVGEAV